jgi:hypothetical protein
LRFASLSCTRSWSFVLTSPRHAPRYCHRHASYCPVDRLLQPAPSLDACARYVPSIARSMRCPVVIVVYAMSSCLRPCLSHCPRRWPRGCGARDRTPRHSPVLTTDSCAPKVYGAYPRCCTRCRHWTNLHSSGPARSAIPRSSRCARCQVILHGPSRFIATFIRLCDVCRLWFLSLCSANHMPLGSRGLAAIYVSLISKLLYSDGLPTH